MRVFRCLARKIRNATDKVLNRVRAEAKTAVGAAHYVPDSEATEMHDDDILKNTSITLALLL